MNKFEFKKFKEWFFNQTETYIKNEQGGFVPIQVPYYQLTPSNRCLRECGHHRNYQFDSWKYFTQYGNKNFIINNDYIEFDTPVDENGNTYNHIDACHMFYQGGVKCYYKSVQNTDGSWSRVLTNVEKHCDKYKHIKIHYRKFCYPLSRHSEDSYNNDNNLYWD